MALDRPAGAALLGPVLARRKPDQYDRSIGALLGVLVFVGVSSASAGGARWRPGEMLASLGIGLLAGVAGAAVLRLLVRDLLRNAPRMVVPVTLMVVAPAETSSRSINQSVNAAQTRSAPTVSPWAMTEKMRPFKCFG